MKVAAILPARNEHGRIARRRKTKVRRIALRRVSHTSEERKFGLANSTAQRAKQRAETGRTLVSARTL
ncbi:MAG: hypothetical protein IH851_00770 [Armatimonadetes bacterium]|nr:hypothetical protein [Armatimonadota bacterium]